MLNFHIYRPPESHIGKKGSNFDFSFILLVALDDIKFERTFIEEHNSMSLYERLHKPISTILRNLFIEHSKQDLDLILALSAKELIDTAGPDG